MSNLDKLRQDKTYGWKPGKTSSKNIKEQIRDLRKQYPNDQEFGEAIAKLIRKWG